MATEFVVLPMEMAKPLFHSSKEKNLLPMYPSQKNLMLYTSEANKKMNSKRKKSEGKTASKSSPVKQRDVSTQTTYVDAATSTAAVASQKQPSTSKITDLEEAKNKAKELMIKQGYLNDQDMILRGFSSIGSFDRAWTYACDGAGVKPAGVNLLLKILQDMNVDINMFDGYVKKQLYKHQQNKSDTPNKWKIF